MVYYHGSAVLFKVFDKEKIGKNYFESDGGGFFFTQKLTSAENYAYLAARCKNNGYVYEVKLTIKNPVKRTTNSEFYSPADYYDIHSFDLLKEVQLEGKDSVVIEGTRNDDIIVVFEPSQIEISKILKDGVEIHLEHKSELLYEYDTSNEQNKNYPIQKM